MKVLFLDIDGVVNDSNTWLPYVIGSKGVAIEDVPFQDWCSQFQPELVAKVNQIVDQTGAQVVLSSSWRKYHTLERINQYLVSAGATFQVIDHTNLYLKRFAAIKRWLNDHPEVKTYVILDDESQSWEDPYPRLIQAETYPQVGLTDSEVKFAIKVLNG